MRNRSMHTDHNYVLMNHHMIDWGEKTRVNTTAIMKQLEPVREESSSV